MRFVNFYCLPLTFTPAAADTIKRYLTERKTDAGEYYAIVTGDLGYEGSELLKEMLYSDGIDISGKHYDCGKLIYDSQTQKVNSGGSGCGCAAVVLAGHFLPEIQKRRGEKMLFAATGAMLSPLAIKQGLTIPSISHLLEISF